MQPSRIFYAGFALALIVALVATNRSWGETGDSDSWSQSTNGLQARITLVEKPKEFGTRWIVPYLELRNVRDMVHPMEVRCDRQHVRFDLVDSAAHVVTNHSSLVRSGPVPDLGTIVLPFDSTIRISMECRNWGIPKAAAMISTDSGAWVIEDSQRGRVFIRATISGERVEGDRYKIWHGKIETPLVKVDWK